MSKKGLIYLVGLLPLGLAYYPIKNMLANDWLFLIGGVSYVILLRLVIERFG